MYRRVSYQRYLLQVVCISGFYMECRTVESDSVCLGRSGWLSFLTLMMGPETAFHSGFCALLMVAC